jgi:thiamine biosynthesis lipoprotein
MQKIILLIIALFNLLVTSCKVSKPDIVNFSGFAQGSTYSIVYDNNKKIDPGELRQRVENILNDFDHSLSLYNDSSILSKINMNEEAVPDSFFTEVYRKSIIVNAMTDGAFDITVGPLVKAWGFGPDKHKTFTEANRDSLRDLVGMSKISMINGRLIKSDPRMYLDFNAIAQGYSVDVISRYLGSQGFKNYLVEIGGEVRATGTKAGKLWRVGIDKPVDNNMTPGQSLQAILKMTDKAIATSGNYRKFFVEDGVKYSHHIDPRTGYTTKNSLLSVSIIADECAIADGVATGCLVMGKEKAIEFIGRHPELEAYMIFSDENGNFKTWVSEKLKKDLSESELYE